MLRRQTLRLQDADYLELGSITTQSLNITGNLQTFRLHDTYAADLTLFPEDPNFELDETHLQYFQPQYLLPNSIQASLGHTLWVYAEVEPTEDLTTLAEKCAIELLRESNLHPMFVHQGLLLGSTLFEYHAVDQQDPEDISKQC